MPAVYVSRISQWIEKRFNAKGGNVIVDIDPTSRVVLPFPVGVEDRYLQGYNRYWSSIVTSASAGNTASIQLRNPIGSNVMAVIEKLAFRLNTAGTTGSGIVLSAQAAVTLDLTTTQTGFRQDIRGNPNSTLILSQQATGGNLTTVVNQSVCTGNTMVDLVLTHDQELVMLPGDALRLTDATVNEAFIGAWIWRERALELSELT